MGLERRTLDSFSRLGFILFYDAAVRGGREWGKLRQTTSQQQRHDTDRQHRAIIHAGGLAGRVVYTPSFRLYLYLYLSLSLCCIRVERLRIVDRGFIFFCCCCARSGVMFFYIDVDWLHGNIKKFKCHRPRRVGESASGRSIKIQSTTKTNNKTTTKRKNIRAEMPPVAKLKCDSDDDVATIQTSSLDDSAVVGPLCRKRGDPSGPLMYWNRVPSLQLENGRLYNRKCVWIPPSLSLSARRGRKTERNYIER